MIRPANALFGHAGDARRPPCAGSVDAQRLPAIDKCVATCLEPPLWLRFFGFWLCANAPEGRPLLPNAVQDTHDASCACVVFQYARLVVLGGARSRACMHWQVLASTPSPPRRPSSSHCRSSFAPRSMTPCVGTLPVHECLGMSSSGVCVFACVCVCLCLCLCGVCLLCACVYVCIGGDVGVGGYVASRLTDRTAELRALLATGTRSPCAELAASADSGTRQLRQAD
jgi:hypothetical protein